MRAISATQSVADVLNFREITIGIPTTLTKWKGAVMLILCPDE